MTLAQLLQIAWSGRWRLILCTLACIAGALVISLRLPKSYEARARVILEVVGADPVTGVVIGTKQVEAYVITQVLLVGSDRVGETAIDKLGWATNPAVIDSWQQQTGGVGDIRKWAAQRLLSEVSARPLEGGGTLEISYRGPEPDAAREITRALRESYIETVLALQTEAAARRAKRFEVLAEKAQRELDAAQASLTQVQRETGMVINADGVDIEGRGLGRAAAEADEAEKVARRSVDRIALNAGAADKIVASRKLAMVEQEIATTAGTLGTDNPTYKALLERRATLVGQLSATAAAARSQVAAAAAAARVMAARPQEEYLRERERVLNQGPDRIKVDAALRLVELRRGELKRLRTNLANALQNAARTESGLVVMGDVISDSTPVSPNIPLNLLLAGLFGIGLGLASVLIDGLSRREVLGEADLVAASGVPVLVTMPGNERARRRWRWPWRRGSGSPSGTPVAA